MSGRMEEATGLPHGFPLREEWEVTPRCLAKELSADPPVVVLDCRTPEEREVARIPGSILVPMDEVSSRREELEAYLDRRVVVYCHRGRRSFQVTAFLRQQGFSDVWSLAGGIDAWSVGIDPSVPRY